MEKVVSNVTLGANLLAKPSLKRDKQTAAKYSSAYLTLVALTLKAMSPRMLDSLTATFATSKSSVQSKSFGLIEEATRNFICYSPIVTAFSKRQDEEGS
jgi:hypothetical protein